MPEKDIITFAERQQLEQAGFSKVEVKTVVPQVKPLSHTDHGKLYDALETLATDNGLPSIRLMVAENPSPDIAVLSGYLDRVVVSKTLLDIPGLKPEEIVALIGSALEERKKAGAQITGNTIVVVATLLGASAGAGITSATLSSDQKMSRRDFLGWTAAGSLTLAGTGGGTTTLLRMNGEAKHPPLLTFDRPALESARAKVDAWQKNHPPLETRAK